MDIKDRENPLLKKKMITLRDINLLFAANAKSQELW